ncbi:MAG TPA: hypothetical protein VKJ01_22165, partial [Candidatus Solibacter sp.]|nr:hypothetical protein [Candidatus Solibacter sp.]
EEIKGAPPPEPAFRHDKCAGLTYRVFFVVVPDSLCYLLGGRLAWLTSAGFGSIINQPLEEYMATMREAEVLSARKDRKLSGIGATEDQMDMRGTIPQRTDKIGTKIEDEAGTGEQDSQGG